MPLTVIEADVVIDVIIARLLTDTGAGGAATLTSNRIYRGTPNTQTPAWPIITVSLLASPALMTADATHVWSDVTALVKISDKGGDYSNVYNLARRCVVMLDGYSDITSAGVYIHKLRSEEHTS